MKNTTALRAARTGSGHASKCFNGCAVRSVVLAALSVLAPSAASAGSPGWVVKCPYSHTSKDDPIKYPGQKGAAHVHDFFGSKTTSFRSSYSAMVGSPTTCGTAGDRSGYWVPALYRNGVKIDPAGESGGQSARQKFYYRDNHYADGTKVEPFPPNFKMIQGYHDAKSVGDANAHGAGWGKTAWWGCSDNSVGGKSTMPVNCKSGIITLHITFPSCWDGVKVDGDAVAAGHVKFPDNGKCPSGFRHALPMLIQRLEYPVGKSSRGITLSSGPPYTAHADFWNTWEQSTLSSLVTRCLNADKSCGTDP